MIPDYEQIKLEIKIDDMIETLKFYAFKNNMIGLREDLDGEIWDTGCRAIETLKYIGIDVESPSYFHDIKNTHALIRRVNSVNDVIRHGIYEDGKEKDRDSQGREVRNSCFHCKEVWYKYPASCRVEQS